MNNDQRASSADWRLEVPPEFAAGVEGHAGESGVAWLKALPDLARELVSRWELTLDGDVMHGFLGVVVPVRRGPDAYALKVSRPSAEVDNQVVSLAAWQGRGMVELVSVEPEHGALLLERLDAGRSLDDVPLDEAVQAAALVLRRLAVPGVDGLPTLAEHVASWPERWLTEWQNLGRPLPRRLLDAAIETCRALAPGAGRLLVDHDLHFRNILAGQREPWLAIDPRGVLGDAEFALPPLIWNRFVGEHEVPERFDRFTEVAELDRDRAKGWLLAVVMDYFLWSTGAGLTWDPAACRIIADWIVGSPVTAAGD
ncbi:aminoglycoside phosphotransferase family protein [Actinoallomurus sp. NPDC050550]|uniref:aminoglycoside phosphotransferase family protein n=1 Tax=Actinoallomurus sp. NPDC050550 TaxID=3154937 RepID=UPI0033EEEDA6